MKHITTITHALMSVGFLYVAAIAASKFYAVLLAIVFAGAAVHAYITTKEDTTTTWKPVYDDRFFEISDSADNNKEA